MLLPDKTVFAKLLHVKAPFSIDEIRFLDEDHHKAVELLIAVDPRYRPDDESGQPCTLHSYYERRWRHLNLFEYRCYIRCRLPRYQSVDGAVKTLEVPWARPGAHFSLLFEQHAMELIEITSNVATVARHLGLRPQRLWHIFQHYTDEALAQRQMPQACAVGIDETARRRGHDYISVFVDIETATVLWIEEGKDAATVERFVEAYPFAEAIKQVSIDMAPAFIRGVSAHLPQAEITFDRFHVARLVARLLEEAKRRGQVCADALAWVRLWFGHLWQSQTVSEAEALLCFVIDFAKEQGLVKLSKSLRRHFEGIVSYVRTGLTNGLLEGINNKIQSIKRVARGYRYTETFRRMIYLCFGSLDLRFEARRPTTIT